MDSLMEQLDILTGDIATSRDLMRILCEETDSVPRKAEDIYNDAGQAARAAWILTRVQTLLSVCFERINIEADKLGKSSKPYSEPYSQRNSPPANDKAHE